MHGYWEYTRENLNIYGITNNFFQKNIPKDLLENYGEGSGRLWMSMTSLYILTIYYAQKDNNKKKKSSTFQKRKFL